MSLFTTKSIADLRADAESNTLRRALGPLNLTTLGIGSIIGTGIFVLTGTAASQNAGPGLVISMIIAGIACGFAGLCYAEFASMIPVAGSAYTYAYATMGELMAWIIGWDLVLEYALSAATVAVGWSGYFSSLLGDFGVSIPAALAGAPGETVAMGSNTAPGLFNLPAALIIILVTTLLVIGIRQSANTNTVLVVIKSMVLVVFVVAGAAYVNRANLTPLVPANTGSFGQFGWSGILRGAGVMFFAYIGFDAVSTAAQEAK
ncbi:MAG TPA: amino acid permease, partial [Gemmatimonadaceae bacterium]|nr:amino acid permease [Gemmatimonadaceae bacterium]